MAEAELAALAAKQAGAFSARQAEAHGFDEASRRRRIEAGRWVRLHRGVFAVAGSVDDPLRMLWAAWLAVGPRAVISHLAALWLWGIPPRPNLRAPELTVPATASLRRPGIVLHRTDDFASLRVNRRLGLNVTDAVRSMIDAASRLPTWAVEDVYDKGIARKLFTPGQVLAGLDRNGRRPGAGAVRKVLLDQGVGAGRSASFLEAKARRLFRRAGLPEPRMELVWGRDGQFRLDFTWVELGLVVEVDGWDCHSSDEAREGDLARRNHIVLTDTRVLNYTYRRIVHDGDRVVSEILDGMALPLSIK